MIRRLVRSMIRNARVTRTEIGGHPGLTVDPHLLAAADIREYESVEIVNLATGDRFTTHVVAGEAGSGAVASLAGIHHPLRVGDTIAIICSALLHEGQILDHRARVVDVDEENRVVNLVESDVAMEP
jgi:aspartate 1-decarboxylase